MARGATLGALLFVAILAGAMYVPGLPGEFVYDDHRLIERNEGLRRAFDPGRAFLRDYYASDNDRMGLGYYRPIAILSNEMDFRRGGGSPLAFHVTNILLHMLCSALVLVLALRVFAGNLPGATAAAVLFALHPAHAESVAFISGRVDPLATLFVLVTALAHLRANHASRAGFLRIAAGAAWLLALLSKEMAVTAPALVFVLESAEEGLPPRSTIGRRLARYLPYAAAVVPYLALRRTALGTLLAPPSGELEASLARPLVAVGSYLVWLVLPPPGVHLEPAPAGGVLGALAAALAAGVVAGTILLWVRGARTASALSAWCVLALLPVAQFRPIETELSERFLYLPSVGACLLLGLPLARVRARSARAVLAALLLALLLVDAWVLHDRARAWRDEVLLWSEKLEEDPASIKALLSLARARAARGDADGARAAYARARALEPSLAPMILGEMESFSGGEGGQGSIEAIRESLAASPRDGALWSNLGFLLLQQRDAIGAREAFERSVALVPTRSNAWLGLALARSATQDVAGADRAAERAVALNPDLDLARVIRAECALHEGRACEALRLAPQETLADAREEALRRSVVERARSACPEP